jgi:hypothetical protein
MFRIKLFVGEIIMKNYKACQSCGMPLSKDELGGGTEKDGRISTKYCSHCYIR